MRISREVTESLEKGLPVVALETTVLAHGLPHPQNLELAREIDEICRSNGVVPAPIGILRGEIIVGMSFEELNILISDEPLKIGTREIPYAVAMKKSAATTVSATVRIAKIVGIDVFATGGIGGVHPGDWDVSQDITEMCKSACIVVSSGCKSILDVRKTIEFLETFQVTVVGYKTKKFPIFYEGLSDYDLDYTVEHPEEVATMFKLKRELAMEGSILVANPIPSEYAISESEVQALINTALTECFERGITGKAVTPYLLSRVAELSGGRTIKANVELIKNNVKLACEIAKELTEMR
ncbi:pseudouridine-5-phosphate glycosidase [Fervidobacterium thailandense]|uniref:Pseudouridine-5'-phosphate glycosidase n=1 Tax=Fervidobacterium thailandense TaxID=1008305 RepID=A0A1E3G5B0_9BACT|nr:pseudouridine-5-phosphate glycosidase [Fervidobacterium thailandense]